MQSCFAGFSRSWSQAPPCALQVNCGLPVPGSPRAWEPALGEEGRPGCSGLRLTSCPASSYAEWCEFSPYEVGMQKYGAFIPSELFGSEFFMGRLMRRIPESQMCYMLGDSWLRGAWGGLPRAGLARLVLPESHPRCWGWLCLSLEHVTPLAFTSIPSSQEASNLS